MRVACIIDTSGKVQHNRVRVFREYLKADFDVFTIDQKFAASEYDVVYYANAGLFEKKRIRHDRLCGSITSHRRYGDLSVFNRLSVNNAMLFDEYSKQHPNVVYIPNGVNTVVYSFVPQSLVKPFRIGWVGNHDRSVKNYDVLKKLMKRFDNRDIYNFDIVDSSKADSSKNLFPLRKMVPYYQRLHYLLVLSTSEGTPNPALEAASCGVPLISTYVGNMPEIITPGRGWLAPRKNDPYDFAVSVLENLPMVDKDTYEQMRYSIRKEIETKWQWEFRATAFENFLLRW